MDIPPHPTAQVTALAWHPIQRILAVGWETGELYLWNDHEEELHQIQSLHRAPISILHFSQAGSRLVTADQVKYSWCLLQLIRCSTGLLFVRCNFTYVIHIKDFQQFRSICT